MAGNSNINDFEDFDFDLDLTETEMLWEKKIEEITDIPIRACSNVTASDLGIPSGHSYCSKASEPTANDIPGQDNEGRKKDAGTGAMEDLEEIDLDEDPPSPSILDDTGSTGGLDSSKATRENSINALRDSLNAFRDDMDTLRDTMMNSNKTSDGNKKRRDAVSLDEAADKDDEKRKEEVKKNVLENVEEEKAVIVNFYDMVDLTDESAMGDPSLGGATTTVDTAGMRDEEMDSLIITSNTERLNSDLNALSKQIQEGSKKPSSSTVSLSTKDTTVNWDVPMCQLCLKAKEKRNCTHRHRPYPLSQGQGPGSPSSQCQGGARSLGRGSFALKLISSRGRGIPSPSLGLDAVKKESKKLKYSVEVQHVKEIFPAVHRHFVKKLLKYLGDRFNDKETILQHAVTFLSDHPYPIDGDAQWEIDAAIDSLKKVVISPAGIDIPKKKVPKPSKERDNFVSNWITQTDFKEAVETVPAGSSSAVGGNAGSSESTSSGVDSRLFGFSHPDVLHLGLPLVPSGTSIRSLGTSIASLANSSPCSSPPSDRDSLDSDIKSPERTSEHAGNSSNSSVDSVKHLGRASLSTGVNNQSRDISDSSSSKNTSAVLTVRDILSISEQGRTNQCSDAKLYPGSPKNSGRTCQPTNKTTIGTGKTWKGTGKPPEQCNMEVETSDLPAQSGGAQPDRCVIFKLDREKFRQDQEKFRKAVSYYKELQAKRTANRKEIEKNTTRMKTGSPAELQTDGIARPDVRPKVTVAESISTGTTRFHPYPQTDKHTTTERKSSMPGFSFSVPLASNQPDSANQGQTVSHPDVSSSIVDDYMTLEDTVSSSSINCENCKATHSMKDLGQCCDGHLLCKACLEKAAKLILVGNKSGQVICPVTDCGSSVPRSELRKCLHSIMVDLLDEKWNKEAVDAMNEMEDFVRCPNCGYSVILDLGVKKHTCDQCKKTFCRFCSLSWSAKNHDFCIKTKTKKTADGLGVIAVPAHWTSTSNIEEPFEQVIVEKTAIEFTSVAELFYKTMTRQTFRVEKVYRIQNQRLWEKYMLMRTHMVADLGEMHINEQRLFHGTSTEVIPAICKEGFDWRLFGRNGSAFGQGTYFARDANYSHNYSAKHGPYMMSSGKGAHAFLNHIILSRMMPPANRSSGHGAFTFGGPPPAHSSGTTVIIQPPSSTTTTQQGFTFGGPSGQPSSSAGAQQQSSGFTFGSSVPTNTGHQQTSGFLFGNSTPNNAGHQQTSGFQFGNSTPNNAGHQQTSGFQFGNSNSGAGTQQQQPGFSSVFGFSSHPFPGSQTGGSNIGGSGFNFGSNSNQSSGTLGSDDMMESSSGHFMFVGRVLVGRLCKGTPDMRRPPKDESDPQKRPCHTAVNHTHKPSIYVVFESAQCYPEYLIEYKNAV